MCIIQPSIPLEHLLSYISFIKVSVQYLQYLPASFASTRKMIRSSVLVAMTTRFTLGNAVSIKKNVNTNKKLHISSQISKLQDS